VPAAEQALPQGGKAVTALLLAGARTTDQNAFKIPLVQRTIDAVLAEAKGKA
jgi:xanthine dehydrogenase YagS FAD-binding subunit